MRCRNCDCDIAEDARFCAQCGTTAVSCPSCAAPVDFAHRFCRELRCAVTLGGGKADGVRKSLPQEDDDGERRQVTVLFGDLTGFTSLSENSDPEATHELLNRYFESVDGVIRAYGGTIDKHIGDGIMAVFGAPTAHSDDPERAMRSAMAIHEVLSQIRSTPNGPCWYRQRHRGGERHWKRHSSRVHSHRRFRKSRRAASGPRHAGRDTGFQKRCMTSAGARFDCTPLGAVE